MNYEKKVEEFAKVASDFCLWVEGGPKNAEEEHFVATKYIARLYLEGLELPICEPTEDHEWSVNKDEYKRIFKRFSSLPFQYYWEVYKPVTDEPEEPVAGDICDDITDIYVDIKNGLTIWDKGSKVDDVFHWKTTFGFHWGDHATSALRALHKYDFEN